MPECRLSWRSKGCKRAESAGKSRRIFTCLPECRQFGQTAFCFFCQPSRKFCQCVWKSCQPACFGTTRPADWRTDARISNPVIRSSRGTPLVLCDQKSVAFPCLCSHFACLCSAKIGCGSANLRRKRGFPLPLLSPFTIFAPSGWLSPWRIGRCDGALTD